MNKKALIAFISLEFFKQGIVNQSPFDWIVPMPGENSMAEDCHANLADEIIASGLPTRLYPHCVAAFMAAYSYHIDDKNCITLALQESIAYCRNFLLVGECDRKEDYDHDTHIAFNKSHFLK